MKQTDFEKKVLSRCVRIFDGNQLKDYENPGVDENNKEFIKLDDIEKAEDINDIMNMYYKAVKILKEEPKAILGDSKKITTLKNQIKSVQERIDRDTKLVETLEYEGEFENEEMIKNAKMRLEQAQEEKKKIEEKIAKQNEKEDLKAITEERVQLESGREVSKDEAIELGIYDTKDALIALFTQKAMQVDKIIPQKEQEREEKRKQWNAFKYEFDGEHNITNKKELEQIINDFHSIEKEIDELSKIKNACNEKMKELKGPSLQEIAEANVKENVVDTEKKDSDFVDTKFTPIVEDKEEKDAESNPYIDRANEYIEALKDGLEDKKVKTNKNLNKGVFAALMGKNIAYSDKDGKYMIYKNDDRDSYEIVSNRVKDLLLFTEDALRRTDCRLIDFLINTDYEMAQKIVNDLNHGKDLSEYADIIRYDMTGAKELKRTDKKIWKEYRKIAKMAEANGLTVEGIEETKTIFDKIKDFFGNMKAKKEQKALTGVKEPQKLNAAKDEKEPENEPENAVQKFKSGYTLGDTYTFNFDDAKAADWNASKTKTDDAEPNKTQDDDMSK